MRTVAVGFAVALALIGCSSGNRQTLDVFAASSLTDAFTEIEASYEQLYPDIDIRLNLAGSNTLQRQLLDGAEGDVFAPADDRLLSAPDLVLFGEPQRYANNRLAMITPAGSTIDATTDLSTVSVARCAPGVPCGDITDRYLEQSGITLGLVTEEANVRAVLAKVAADEIDVGFVYVTDALAAGDAVRIVPIVEAPTTTLALAAVSDDPEAMGFINYVITGLGRQVLREHGFDLS